MTELEALLNLPFQTIALLASGYMAYRIAYTGKDTTHAPVDVVFLTFVFAFAAKLGAQIFGSVPHPFAQPLPQAASALFGLCLALLIACGWRRYGEGAAFNALRRIGVSNSDRQLTAWQSIIANPRLRLTQVMVRRTDGTFLMCDRVSTFAHHSPRLILGSDGSIALHVTHQMGAADADWEAIDVAGPDDWGNLITYIPASQVAQIHLRSK